MVGHSQARPSSSIEQVKYRTSIKQLCFGSIEQEIEQVQYCIRIVIYEINRWSTVGVGRCIEEGQTKDLAAS